MSPSSAWVTYQPEGAGQRARTALFDTSLIPDPENWLAKRLGPLARCEVGLRGDEISTEDKTPADPDDGAGEGVPSALHMNPAAGEQAGAPPHARDVPNNPPTTEISS